jgi:hypothetical protein
VSGRRDVIVLVVAGLAAAVLLGLSGYVIARDTIALPATTLPSGDALAPPAATRADTRPAPPPAPTTTTTGTTGDDDDRGTTTTGDDNSGPGSDDSGQGRGRGRGRGGDD